MLKDIVQVVRDGDRQQIWSWSVDHDVRVLDVSDERIKGILRVAPQCTYVEYGVDDGVVGFELHFVEGVEPISQDEVDGLYAWAEKHMDIYMREKDIEYVGQLLGELFWQGNYHAKITLSWDGIGLTCLPVDGALMDQTYEQFRFNELDKVVKKLEALRDGE